MKIEITETFQHVVEVDETDIGEAIATVSKQYTNNEIILDWKNFMGVDFDVFSDVHFRRVCDNYDIRAIVEYLWQNEEKNWMERGCPDDHIFHVLRRLK